MPSRLLSIELQGYKTFANRYKFDFPGVITCVVGPNGSGKSNVADAIRWVLGEQSLNLLRGRKTEDMIFSGSSQRPKAGMASVTITFNNEDNWFPLDFSEVAISRRAYRDGQNEYFINNQKVRLKDVVELLAQAGVTPRTYTIIGQGLVDAALSLRPDERRQFFEEAAGITIHRKRREEALHRLESTQRNLDRVKDILSELKPRLSSLEKQARRVIEQERIKTDLKLLMKDWYGFQWHKSQAELKRADELLKAQQEHLEKSGKQKETVDQAVLSLQEELNRFRVDLSKWHLDTATIHKELDSVNRSIAVLDERTRSLVEQTNFLQTDLVRIEEEEIASTAQVEKEKEEKTTVIAEKAEMTRFLSETEKKNNMLFQQKQELSRERGKLDHQHSNLETEKIRLKSQIQEITNQRDRFISSQTNLEKDQLDLGRSKGEAEKTKLDLQQQIVTIKNDFEECTQALKATSIKLSTLEKEMDLFSSKLHEVENNRSRKAAQLEVFRGSITSNEHLNSSAQAFLKILKGSGKTGNIHSLVNSFSVQKGYEKAVAAGLGEYIDGLILSDDADLENVSNIARSRDIGRVIVFLNLTGLHPNTEQKCSEDGFLGTAHDFVQFQSANPVIEALLDDIYVVENSASALQLSRKVQKNVCVVTTSGEVFRGNQSVILGKDQREGVFVIQQKITELTGEINELIRKASELTSEIKGKGDQINKVLEVRKQQETVLAESRRILENLQLQNQKSELQLTRVTEQLNSHASRVKELEKQNSEVSEKISVSQKRLEEVSSKANELFISLQEKSRQAREIGLDEVQLELTHWRTKLAVTQRSIEEVERRLNGSMQRTSNLVNQKKNILDRVGSISEEILTAQEKQTSYAAQVQVLNERLDDLNAKMQPTEEIVSSLEKKIRKQVEEQTLIQQRLTTAERYVTQAQLDYSRRKDELEKLQEKIEDDFGLVSFEYQNQIVGPQPLPLGGLVDTLPENPVISADVEETIDRYKAQLRRLGPINQDAKLEYEEVKERFEHLTSQSADLQSADEDLREIIRELDELMKIEFQNTFRHVAHEFREMFTRLFGGGTARLILMDEENPTDGGIEIEATLPGKRKQGLAVLSGGERSLTAVALIFALLKVSPTPFCVLDEVDAALDEANVGRFGELLRELSTQTQFLAITHNRNTVQLADVIYGVTMGRDSTSQVISLMMNEVGDSLVS